MKKRTNWFIGALQACCIVGAVSLVACTDDNFERQGSDTSGVRVNFVVSDAQQDAQDEGKTLVRGLSDVLSTEDFNPRRLEADGATDACLVETTVEGINPVINTVATRGNVVTSITTNFSSVGYRSSTSGFSMTSMPVWFHNKATQPNGTLVEPMLWSWAQPYGRFYAIAPQVTEGDSKLRLSDASHTGTPYVDFEVAEDVRQQRDLLTASSGQVHYAVQGQAPDIYLKFYHALTAVRFAVGQNLSWDKTIDKVEIRNALSKGRYQLADEANTNGTWSGMSDRKTFALSSIAVSTKEAVNHVLTGKNNDNFTFFMLPQDLTGNDIKVYIHFTDNTSLTVPLKGKWLAGTTKTYTLSQKTSNWEYVLTAESPAPLAYNMAQSGHYKVTSYRHAPDGTKQAVDWKVVGYDADDDGNFALSEKPNWLQNLSAEQGSGSAEGAANVGTATVVAENLAERLPEINQSMKDAPIKGSVGNYYNLANQTDGGASIENTANCYVISAPGHYRLPLVYGNAVKNGNDNEVSYKPGVSGQYVLANFKGHDGNDITTPYINVQHSTNPATQAGIVWADVAGLVSNPAVQGNGQDAFLTFEVKREHLVNGNAVVAVKNASGTTMWSWHLWFVPQRAINTIPVTNRTNKTYNFTEDALGTKYTTWRSTSYYTPRKVKVQVEQGVTNGGSKKVAVFEIIQKEQVIKRGLITYYQFGRKDAFPGSNQVAEGSFTTNAGSNITFERAIQNPGHYYVNGDKSAWTVGGSYGYNNLWSAKNTAYGFNDNPVVKTIYDPSPVGFSLPASNAFTRFTTHGQNTNNRSQYNVSGNWSDGWNFYTDDSKTRTMFFPVTGYRSKQHGGIMSPSATGHFWSAMPAEGFNACYLYFFSYEVHPIHTHDRARGYCVWPVSETP